MTLILFVAKVPPSPAFLLKVFYLKGLGSYFKCKVLILEVAIS